MGPTASGKTNCAMELSEKIDARLISVDSAQVYKGLDIGTGKPSPEILKQYPHDLINIVEPYETYSAYQFQVDALRAIDEAIAEKKLPILVGGTMLYFKSLLEGFANLPGADEGIRKKIEEQAARHGWPVVHETLRLVDPMTAAKLEANDSQRINRALEVFYLTGVPLSTLIKNQTRPELPFSPICVGIAPLDGHRGQLHQNIEKRFESMLSQGLIQEVIDLMTQENFSADLPAFKSVGYRQVIEHLNGDYDKNELLDRGCAATRQLAKRQLTWLRSWKNIHIEDCFSSDLVNNVFHLISR